MERRGSRAITIETEIWLCAGTEMTSLPCALGRGGKRLPYLWKVNMSAQRVLSIWAVLSILYATLYVALFALVRHDVELVRVVSDILTPSAALLIIGDMVSKTFASLGKSG